MTKRTRKEEYDVARDGLIARRSGAWARDKLSFLDEYLPPALQVTSSIPQRYYVDLFAGPGRNIDEDKKEFDGSAIRALNARAQANPELGFTHAVLVNLDPDADAALRQRIENHCADGRCSVPMHDIAYENGDTNSIVHAIMRRVPRRAYIFVFADIEAPNQLPFDTIRALKMHDHRSVDLCVLFPNDMALRRMLPYDPEKLKPNIAALNAFFGTDRWLELWGRRGTQSQSPELYRNLQRLYEDQLKSVTWSHVVEPRHVHRQGHASLYKLLLASNRPVAAKLASWSAKKEKNRRQFGLDFGDAD